MAQVKDPVCGMMVDPSTAPGQSSYQGTTYHFCSAQCLRQFESDPARYVSGRSAGAADAAEAPVERERHEPPYTKWGGLAAPKFGAAGSGGAEYERLPEAHDDPRDDR